MVQAYEPWCYNPCNMTVEDEETTYLEFQKLTTTDSVKVIFFDIYIGNQSFNSNDPLLHYVWVKNDFGRAVFTLPSSFIAMSFSLYAIFIATLNITLTDPTHDCYKLNSHDEYCKKKIIFKKK